MMLIYPSVAMAVVTTKRRLVTLPLYATSNVSTVIQFEFRGSGTLVRYNVTSTPVSRIMTNALRPSSSTHKKVN
jgi:hypothetical protein